MSFLSKYYAEGIGVTKDPKKAKYLTGLSEQKRKKEERKEKTKGCIYVILKCILIYIIIKKNTG